MSRDPYAPPESKEEQFAEVARILGVALHRWHRLNQAKVARHEKRLDQPAAASEAIPAPDQISSGLSQ